MIESISVYTDPKIIEEIDSIKKRLDNLEKQTKTITMSKWIETKEGKDCLKIIEEYGDKK